MLLHIIQQNNWSQVLVFTRTKFGANNVAEFLTKMACRPWHCTATRASARTQALAGFKSGEIRALVATDIAARGIDIDELPHVVNYEIPNVPEDYVHRIGRTGRAGNSGEAVSLVCMDEEGFMMEIERFTKQEIPVQVLDGTGPGRRRAGGAHCHGPANHLGRRRSSPSREVMQAAAKAARSEMMDRIRTNKAGQGDRGVRSGSAGGGNGGRRSGGGGRQCPRNAPGQGGAQGQAPARNRPAWGGGGGGHRFDDQPHGTTPTWVRTAGTACRPSAIRGTLRSQTPCAPAWTRMTDRGRRGGGGGRSGGYGGGGGGRSGGGGGGRSGGGSRGSYGR